MNHKNYIDFKLSFDFISLFVADKKLELENNHMRKMLKMQDEIEKFTREKVFMHIKEEIDNSHNIFSSLTSKIEYSVTSGQFFIVDSEIPFIKLSFEELFGSHIYYKGGACKNDIQLRTFDLYNLTEKDEKY